MSLVAYDSSSESGDSDHEKHAQQPKRSLTPVLPTPKNTIYVDLPKLEADKNQNDEERQIKRPKISVGLGLADLLPTPKNTSSTMTVMKSKAKKSYIPHALSKKMKNKSKESKVMPNAVQEEEEELTKEAKPIQHNGPFFRLGKELRSGSASKSSPKPAVSLHEEFTVGKEPPKLGDEMTAVDIYSYDPNNIYSTDTAAYYQHQQEQQAYYDSLQETEHFENITGLKPDSNIRSVNQSDMLFSDEDRVTRALVQAPKFETSVPVSSI